jgi:hypothetical protein
MVEEVLMRSYLKSLTVEEEVGCNVVSHEIQLVVCPILRGCDGRGVYHRLILFGSDLNLLSEMHISIKDRVN